MKNNNINMLKFETELWEQDFTLVAGVDEAGRGCLAGPVVAAAVILMPGVDIEGVYDSKQMSAKAREESAQVIKENCMAWAVSASAAKVVDRINVLAASLRAMRNSIGRLEFEPNYILIDGNRLPEGLPENSKCIIGGDGLSRSIAAASVLAKVTRDRLMVNLDKIYPGFGFARNKGYGTEEHRRVLQKLGPTPHHRFSFAPVREITLDF